jgi:BirA family transcriptional regulator, biotin operon repressor / biotin---[acetyl-CoA-carboxylase] ligase
MKLIKLDAIDSTNEFLKELSKNQDLENFTTVVAEYQTKGKGQMGAKWISDKGKNLIVSTLIKNYTLSIDTIYNLNVMVSVAIVAVLKELNFDSITIKWPNDIMAENKKIGGILIENSIKSATKIESIIGFGINVNQMDFSELPFATSLALLNEKEYDLEFLLHLIIEKIKQLSSENDTVFLWEKYHDSLFKKNTPMLFEEVNNSNFIGIIKEVSKEGKLIVIDESHQERSYSLKEIKMLY